MRDIKFRAWDAKTKRFIERVPNLEYLIDRPDEEISHHDHDDEAGLYFYPSNPLGPNFKSRIVYQQFTGLLDSQGKEIYEGDIVELFNDPDELYEVLYSSFDNDVAGFLLENKNGRGSWFNARERTIVGNIFQNPELLQ